MLFLFTSFKEKFRYHIGNSKIKKFRSQIGNSRVKKFIFGMGNSSIKKKTGSDKNRQDQTGT
jgi:hypothetical protein